MMMDLMEWLQARFDRDYRTTAAKMVRDLNTQLRRTEEDLRLMKVRDQCHFNEVMAMRDRMDKVINDPAMKKFFKKELEKQIERLAFAWFRHAHDRYFDMILPQLVRKIDLKVEVVGPDMMDFERLGYMLDLRIPGVGQRQPIL